MAINLDNYFGIHEQALKLRSQRAEVLANNLANADTPGFKARDLDFQSVLQQAAGQSKGMMRRTDEQHFSTELSGDGSARMMYRNSTQPDTGDGNTVDTDGEKMRYAQNAFEYNMSLDFLTSKIKGMTKALKGE